MRRCGNVGVMRRVWFFAAILVLASCAPLLQPEQSRRSLPPAVAAPGVLVFKGASGAPLLNAYLPLEAPPGSTISQQTYAGKTSFSRFTNPQGFDEVRRFLLAALEDAGWRVVESTTWEKPPNIFQTTVRVAKDGEQKVVVVRLENGQFSVEVRGE